MTSSGVELALSRLAKEVPSGLVRDVPLDKLSRWQIGGRANALIEPASESEVSIVMRFMNQAGIPFSVIGDTSNVLFDSAGYNGVLVKIGRKMSGVSIDRGLVRAQAGIAVPQLARVVGEAGLTGLEHTVGIPGSLGGLILMNGGSQQRGVGENVENVKCVDGAGHVHSLTHDECGFEYRSSRLQGSSSIVVEASLVLEPGDPVAISREMDDILSSRARRFPSSLPNCGSTFLSDPALYGVIGSPGHAIESAGLKGISRGGAQVSPMHANFIVNNGHATSDDVLWLIALVRKRVHDQTGYWLNCEVRHFSPDGRVRAAYVAAEERWRL